MTDVREQLAEIIHAELDRQNDGSKTYGIVDAPQIADAILAAWPELAGWQPIETAPQDGTEILAAWDCPTPEFRCVCVVFWSAREWLSAPGHWSKTPTHWRPLPAP